MSTQTMGAGLFFVRILAAMIPCFAIWWFLGDWWLQPAADLANWCLSALLPDSFNSLQLVDGNLQAATNWGEVQGRLVPARAAGYALAFESNVRVLSYSVPFFCALQLALCLRVSPIKLGLSLLIMYLVIALSMVFLAAKTVMVGLGSAFIEVNRYWYASRELIALGYQLVTLMLPVLVPVFLWVISNEQQLKALFLSSSKSVPSAEQEELE